MYSKLTHQPLTVTSRWLPRYSCKCRSSRGHICLLLVSVLFPARVEYSTPVLSVIHMLLVTNQMCDWLPSSNATMFGILEYPLAFSRNLLTPCWCNDMPLSAEGLVVSTFR